MKPHVFLKQMLAKGYNIPESIHPFRNGRIDTSKIKSSEEIVHNLLNTGDSVYISVHGTVCHNIIPSLLFRSLFLGTSFFPDYWGVSKIWKSVVICDPDNVGKFHQWMLAEAIEDYLIFDSTKLLSSPGIYKAMLIDRHPKVCIVIAESMKPDLLARFIDECRTRSIATVVCDNEFTLKKLPDPEKILSVTKKKGSLIVEQKQRFDSESELTLCLIKSDDKWRIETISEEEADMILERGQIGVEPGIDYRDEEV